MKTIPLNNGRVAVVDDEDYERVSQFHWSPTAAGHTVYVRTNVKGVDGKWHTLKLHRLVLGISDPEVEVDHINHSGYDNRKVNLRPCTHTENMRNRRDAKKRYQPEVIALSVALQLMRA